MFDEKTILARLQNGEDAQTIANEMAAMINAANKTYADQKAAEEAKKKAEEEAKKQLNLQKRDDLQEILDQLAVWFNAYYDVEESVWDEIDANAVLQLIDSVQEYVKAMSDLTAVFGAKKPAAKPVKKIVKTQSADDTLAAFLNKMGW
jgi:hypothetical protein